MADASGDPAPGCRRRSSRLVPTGATHGGVPVAAGAGDQAAGALGVGVVAEGGPASVVLGTSGVVFAALDRYAHDPEGARARLLPRGAGGMARDGRDAQRRRLAALAARRARRRDLRRAARRRGRRGSRAPRACSSRPTWPASARRTPTRTPAAPSPAWACATTAAPWRARCSRASPSRCATRSTCVEELGGAGASGASRAAARARAVARDRGLGARAAAGGDAVDEGAAYGAALLGGVAAGVWDGAREAVAACVRPVARVEPRAEWIEAYGERASASGRSIPRCGRWAVASREHADASGRADRLRPRRVGVPRAARRGRSRPGADLDRHLATRNGPPGPVPRYPDASGSSGPPTTCCDRPRTTSW